MDKFTALPTDAGVRIDVFVARRYPEFTRSALAKLFELELIKINDHLVKPSHKLKNGDQVAIDNSLLKSSPTNIDIPVLYEDNDVIVVNKPSGVLTHSKGALNLEPTVASFIKDKLTDRTLTGDRAGIVHRLDRGTSGVLICAKSLSALKYLQNQFATRKTSKTYLAIVEGLPNPPEGRIDIPIARNPKNPKTFMPSNAGKPAQTSYKTIRQFDIGGKKVCLVQLTPVSGRTHQLRIHMKQIGHPIVGDSFYGNDFDSVDRLMLHAWRLEVTLPSGIKKEFEAPLPSEFSSK